jgi:hypothetical protein
VRHWMIWSKVPDLLRLCSRAQAPHSFASPRADTIFRCRRFS